MTDDEKLARALTDAMFSLLYEGDHTIRNGPDEDEIYAVLLDAIKRNRVLPRRA